MLLVEDEAPVRRALHQALTQRGYTVRAFSSAEELLALPASELSSSALLISDVQLGGLDGLSLCRRLTESVPQLRCLMISGYVPDDEMQAELSGGRLPFLSKPFSPEGLARRVREVLDQ